MCMLGPAARGGTKGLWSLADGLVGLMDGYVWGMNECGQWEGFSRYSEYFWSFSAE